MRENAGKCGMREIKQKCGNFTVIAGNLEGLHCTASGTSESVNIVQMKRNGSNYLKGRNLYKLSLKNA